MIQCPCFCEHLQAFRISKRIHVFFVSFQYSWGEMLVWRVREYYTVVYLALSQRVAHWCVVADLNSLRLISVSWQRKNMFIRLKEIHFGFRQFTNTRDFTMQLLLYLTDEKYVLGIICILMQEVNNHELSCCPLRYGWNNSKSRLETYSDADKLIYKIIINIHIALFLEITQIIIRVKVS